LLKKPQFGVGDACSVTSPPRNTSRYKRDLRENDLFSAESKKPKPKLAPLETQDRVDATKLSPVE
jgi:hypothetical protein